MTNRIISEEQERKLEESGYAVVPKEPTTGLLVSMALRYDHGFLMPSSDDPISQMQSMSQSERLNILTQMRQLHEEVVGRGFYSPDRESQYTADFENVQENTSDNK